MDLLGCRQSLKNARIRELIAQPSDLEHLEAISCWEKSAFGLESSSIVGSLIWPNYLPSMRLTKLEINEDQLIHFLERRKNTLCSLHPTHCALHLVLRPAQCQKSMHRFS